MEENKKLILRGSVYTGMRDKIYSQGGGGHGWWLGRLTFTKDRLDIYSGISKYAFLKEDIVSIEPYTQDFFLNKKGIKINHKINNYYPFIIFTPSILAIETSEDLINKIKLTGFLDKNSYSVDQSTINEVRKIQNDQMPLFIWLYIIVTIIFIICYFTFGWNFLDKIL